MLLYVQEVVKRVYSLMVDLGASISPKIWQTNIGAQPLRKEELLVSPFGRDKSTDELGGTLSGETMSHGWRRRDCR